MIGETGSKPGRIGADLQQGSPAGEERGNLPPERGVIGLTQIEDEILQRRVIEPLLLWAQRNEDPVESLRGQFRQDIGLKVPSEHTSVTKDPLYRRPRLVTILWDRRTAEGQTEVDQVELLD